MALLFLACISTSVVSGTLDPAYPERSEAHPWYDAILDPAIAKVALETVAGEDKEAAVQEVELAVGVLVRLVAGQQDLLEKQLCALVRVARDQWSEPFQASFPVLDCSGRTRSNANLANLLV